MHLLPLSLVALCCAYPAYARVHWSLAEDLYAFPKYRVTFLNGLPVSNDTAERWLAEGLKGGELEFLDQPWQEAGIPTSQGLKEIASGDGETSGEASTPQASPYILERMKLSGKNPYVCLIPPPVETHTQPEEEPQVEASPAQTWSLLQPLSGSCLFHRQGWFTYAYCHNNHVRQFREVAHSLPHHAGYVPEEDPEWEAFTLGQAATIPGEERELTSAQHAALTSNVDIARTAGHRYLVQKWGDGTICDKSGRPREIEVQFHCSTSMTDTILFVKETKTCHYVMVINTPRLCGEPGFKTRLEQREEAFIRCREVLESQDAIDAADKTLPEAAFPFHRRPARNPILGVPPPITTSEADKPVTYDKKSSDVIKSLLEAILAGSNSPQEGLDGATFNIIPGKDGEYIIEIVEPGADGDSETLEESYGDFLGGASGKLEERLLEILRAAGHDVSNPQGEADGTEQQKQEETGDARAAKHEEL